MDKYLSIKEFAEKCGSDRSVILRLIQSGRLPAERIGNQWIIPADAELPPDGRIKSGQSLAGEKPKKNNFASEPSVWAALILAIAFKSASSQTQDSPLRPLM